MNLSKLVQRLDMTGQLTLPVKQPTGIPSFAGGSTTHTGGHREDELYR